VPLSMRTKLFRPEDGVFGSLGHAELDHALGGDLDGFARGRITADASFAVDELQLAETGNGEVILGLLVSELNDRLNDLRRCLLADVILRGDFGDDL